jgi:hypothetical protein
MLRLMIMALGLAIICFGCSPNPHIIIQTRLGDMEIELYTGSAPGHVANFLKLVE